MASAYPTPAPCLIAGNKIGTDASGSAALGNQGDGIHAGAATAATFGGTTEAARNLISGNAMNGIVLFGTGTFRDVVEGNYIGTDASGSVALGNGDSGVDIQGTPLNTIGGTATGAGNLISANGTGTDPFRKDGITIESGDLDGNGNLIQGNLIGTDADGTANLGNAGNGLDVLGSQLTIGGTASGAANTIAFSGNDGVRVNGGINDLISGNAIFANTGLGIDLFQGGNQAQPAPVLTFTPPPGGSGNGVLAGTLAAARNTTYSIEIFTNATLPVAGHEQGQSFLTATSVTTDSGGSGSFSLLEPTAIYTATATNPTNDTSPFSNAAGTAGASTTVNLNVTAAIDSGPVAVGSDLDYTFTVANQGTGMATGVILSHMLPVNVNFVSASASQGSATQTAGLVTASLGTILGGGSATLRVDVVPLTTGPFTLASTVIADKGLLNPSQGSTSIPIDVSPPPPTNVAANRIIGAGGPSMLSVTWSFTNPPGETATFNVYRSETPGGEGTTPYMTGVTTNQFTDTGQVPGHVYYYQVTANIGGLESLHSAEALGTILVAPTNKPAQLVGLDDGSTAVILQWSYPAAVGAAVTFNVYRSTNPGGEGATPYQTGAGEDPYQLDSFVGALSVNSLPDSAYYYEVSAVVAGHEGPRSAEVKETVPPLPAPSLSGLVTAPDVLDGLVNVFLQWSNPDPTAPSLAYRVHREDGQIEYQGTGNSVIVPLAPASTHSFEVDALVGSYEGPPSAQVQATAPELMAPFASVHFNSRLANGQVPVNIDWTNPYPNAPPSGVTFELFRSTTPGGELATEYLGSDQLSEELQGEEGDTTVGILVNAAPGSTYYYQVRAVVEGFNTPLSNEVAVTVPGGAAERQGHPS